MWTCLPSSRLELNLNMNKTSNGSKLRFSSTSSARIQVSRCSHRLHQSIPTLRLTFNQIAPAYHVTEAQVYKHYKRVGCSALESCCLLERGCGSITALWCPGEPLLAYPTLRWFCPHSFAHSRNPTSSHRTTCKRLAQCRATLGRLATWILHRDQGGRAICPRLFWLPHPL
jgi:hypothetical protein